MPQSGQSISEFLDDLWSELREPAGADSRQQPPPCDSRAGGGHPCGSNLSSGSSNPAVLDGKSGSGPQPAASEPPAHDQLPVRDPAAVQYEPQRLERVVPQKPGQPVPGDGPVTVSPALASAASALAAPETAVPAAALSPAAASAADTSAPPVPRTLRATGLSADWLSRLILKLLAARGALTGRNIAGHIQLTFPLIERLLNDLRREQFVVLKGEAIAGDYTYLITEQGLKLAREFARECTYFGTAPVTIDQYNRTVARQSVADVRVRPADLQRAFHDLLIDDAMLKILGPAINSGRGLFLFGEPGNGKTSIAERVTRAFGSPIWIPRAILIDGQIIRVFDPGIHCPVAPDSPDYPARDPGEVDQRWVCIRRPTVIAGGELTMNELEVTEDPATHISEAPLQLKSNGGVLLIDDFGRQRMPVDELLNRWIVPLEKRYDLLNLPNGKKVRVPFDQLVIFSTNLEPRDLVDDAFLRRIPYKVEVPNPTPEQFHALFRMMCRELDIAYHRDAIDYLIQAHYQRCGRSLRACHPRDLLLQIRNFCLYEDVPMQLTRDSIDFAVRCYFSVLS